MMTQNPWKLIAAGVWQRKTRRRTGHIWQSGINYHWVVYNRHQPDLAQTVKRIGAGDCSTLDQASQYADELIEINPDQRGVQNIVRKSPKDDQIGC